jgi:phytoene synthase
MARDTNFYYSFLVLPPEKRRAIISVWDFCRAVDDAVDERVDATNPDPGRALAEWREEVAACFENGSPRTAQGRTLQPLVGTFGLPRAPFEALIDGVAMDITPRRYESFEDLYEYCYRVASTVGLICVEIFGYRNPGTRDYAVNLGVALQLTNIIRDVAADAVRDRLYIPLEDLARFGCSEQQVMCGTLSDALVRLLEHQCARAHGYYSRARRALPREDRRGLVAAEIMGGIYSAILRRIELRGYDVYSHIVRVPRPTRAAIAARVWLKTMLGSS